MHFCGRRTGRWRRSVTAAAVALVVAVLGSCADPGEEKSGQSGPREGTTAASPSGPQLPDAGSAADFYNLPPEIPAGDPGRLIKVQTLEMPEGVRGWRVLYHSTSVDGRDIAVSGLVYAPDSSVDPGSRPVVSWGHGSVGLGDVCAPSRSPRALLTQSIFAELLDEGFVVVATDYEGLGTPGVHPWLVGLSEGRGMLDIVRAAGQIPGSGAGNRLVAFGASQGGGAALFAGELVSTYAKNLELLGVVAAAPAAELDLLALLPEQNLAGIAGFVVMGTLGFAAAYPQLPLDAVLQPEVISQREEVERLCQGEIDRRFRNFPLQRILKASPGTVDQWTDVITENTPGRQSTPAPVLVVHGNRDRVVPVEISELLFQRLCRLQVAAEKQVYDGVDHVGVIGASSEDVLGWIIDREQGRAPGERPGVARCA